MSKQAFSEITNNAKTMVSGLTSNADTVARRGLDAEFIAKLGETLNTINTLDNEQESLKAQLKTKTATLDATLKELKAMLSESKKVVKMSVDQSGWLEFGITDSK